MNKMGLIIQIIMFVWGTVLFVWASIDGDIVKAVAGHVWLVGSILYGRRGE